MNLPELIKTLPNGFHDSALESINIDFENNSVELYLNVWIDEGPIAGKYEDNRKMGRLYLEGMHYFNLESDLFLSIQSKQKGATSISVGHDYSKVAKPKFYKESLNTGWIYFNEYNAFIHFSVEKIRFEWS